MLKEQAKIMVALFPFERKVKKKNCTSTLKTQNSILLTQNSRLKTQDSILKTLDSKLKTQYSKRATSFEAALLIYVFLIGRLRSTYSYCLIISVLQSSCGDIHHHQQLPSRCMYQLPNLRCCIGMSTICVHQLPPCRLA
jgi:hypothetical protein